MFGGTLSDNGTLVGASAHIVAAGIATQASSRVPFRRFLRYGVPVTDLQLAAVRAVAPGSTGWSLLEWVCEPRSLRASHCPWYLELLIPFCPGRSTNLVLKYSLPREINKFLYFFHS
jgi:hypothetical protein